MSKLRSFSLFLSLSAAFAAPAASLAQASQPNRTPVIVELFTSEGCSSCPPADALLARLDRDQPIAGAQIIVLGEHVDYWDNLGWHDRFSSHEYTNRQSGYSAKLDLADVYTPQMIVDGTDQFVGNDSSHARRAIQNATQSPKVALTLSHPVLDGSKISAVVSFPVSPATKPRADLYAALVDPTDSTEVRGGENGGHTLHHVGVVRSLQRIGSLKDLLSHPVSFTLNAPADSKPGEMRVVVFAQQGDQGAIVGAVQESVRESAQGAVPGTGSGAVARLTP
jgi:hypothetical protein